MHSLKTPTNEPPRRRGDNNKRTSGATSVRGEINVQDEDLVTTVMRAAEKIAAPLLPPPHHHAPQFATPEDYDESVLPHDFDRLLALTGQIRALMTRDPKLARQAANAREAFGDGETLKILFRRLFPDQHTQVYCNPDGSPILTPREVEVLKEAAKDLGRDEIAARLNITPRTAATHLANIYAKLHVQRPMQAVARAISMGFLDTDVLGFITGAASAGPRNFRLFDSLASDAQPVGRAPLDATVRPLAEFGLLMLLCAGEVARYMSQQACAQQRPRALVCEFDLAGRLVHSFGSDCLVDQTGLVIAPPHAARQGFQPGNLFVSSGRLPATELNDTAIYEFSPKGKLARTICGGREIGSRLTSRAPAAFHTDGRLLVPSGGWTDALLAFRRGGARVRRFANLICGQVAVSPSGDVYAAHRSSAGDHIRVYNARGRLLRAFGHTPPLAGNIGIAVNSQGHTWVNYIENNDYMLKEFGPDSELLRVLSLPGLGNSCLALDESDHLYVPCPRSGDIKVLTPDGKIARRIDLRGKLTPTCAAVGPEGQLYIAGNE